MVLVCSGLKVKLGNNVHRQPSKPRGLIPKKLPPNTMRNYTTEIQLTNVLIGLRNTGLKELVRNIGTTVTAGWKDAR
jgi:hypothetical protein